MGANARESVVEAQHQARLSLLKATQEATKALLPEIQQYVAQRMAEAFPMEEGPAKAFVGWYTSLAEGGIAYGMYRSYGVIMRALSRAQAKDGVPVSAFFVAEAAAGALIDAMTTGKRVNRKLAHDWLEAGCRTECIRGYEAPVAPILAGATLLVRDPLETDMFADFDTDDIMLKVSIRCLPKPPNPLVELVKE